MVRVFAMALAAALAAPAFAQASAPEPPTMDEARVSWAKPPTIRDLVRRYPRIAKVEQVRRGKAKVHCTARANGSLACVSGEQSPDGYGFGEAAVAVVEPARVKATDGGSLEGRTFVFTVKFGDWSPQAAAPEATEPSRAT